MHIVILKKESSAIICQTLCCPFIFHHTYIKKILISRKQEYTKFIIDDNASRASPFHLNGRQFLIKIREIKIRDKPDLSNCQILCLDMANKIKGPESSTWYHMLQVPEYSTRKWTLTENVGENLLKKGPVTSLCF